MSTIETGAGFLASGIISNILGIIALLASVWATIAFTMFVFGWLLLIVGIVEAVQTFRHWRSGHVFFHALNAALSFVVGLMMLRHPFAEALVGTLLLGAYFTVTGIFHIVTALSLRLPNWGWNLTRQRDYHSYCWEFSYGISGRNRVCGLSDYLESI